MQEAAQRETTAVGHAVMVDQEVLVIVKVWAELGEAATRAAGPRRPRASKERVILV